MRLELKRENGEIVGHNVRVGEYEPLSIRLITGRTVKRAPDVVLDGASIGSPKVAVGTDEISWNWVFRSESWCGRSHLTVSSDAPPITIIVQSVPSGSKYSEDAYEQMLNRLLSYNSNLLWGLAPGQRSASDVTSSSPTLAHPALVEHYLDPLLRQLDHVLEAPVLRAFKEEEIRTFDPTRPLRPHTLRWLGARPAQTERLRSGDLEVRVPQQRHLETYDHPANRYVVTLILRLCSMFDRSARALAAFGKKGLLGDLERARTTYLARRLAMSSERLRTALDHPVLGNVRPGPMSEGVTQVFADHPHYGRFGRFARRLLCNGIETDTSGALEASLRRSWDLFELYCLHRLVETLQDALGPAWTFERTGYIQTVLCAPPEGLFWRARNDSGEGWELLYQQWFARNGDGPSSITTGRQPDFVLCRYVDGSLTSWILLDAKYRSSELSLNDALEAMHIYRDSLRWSASEQAIPAQAGYLLVPQVTAPLTKYANDQFLGRWRIGIINIDDDTLGARLVSQS